MKNYIELQNGSDIRGIALDIGGKEINLTTEAVSDLSRAFALWLSQRTGKDCKNLCISLGRDSRISGENLLCTASKAISSLGTKVLDCGMASTPAMFMSIIFEETKADGAIMITASHLPSDRNGLKFFTKDGGLEKADIKELVTIAQSTNFDIKTAGELIYCDLLSIYAGHLKNIITNALGKEKEPLKGLKIVVDAGNGAGGFYATEVLKPLGADINGSQFLNPDGTFPNHIPNPENDDAMASICQAVKDNKADLGLIFDTDVDRAAAVDSTGCGIARNRIVALAAFLASENHPRTTVVTDSITSVQLKDFLEKDLHLTHLRFKRGYKNVIDKGIELNANGTDCQLAIETSGHAALKENYFLDDGAYLATKIVIKAAQLKKHGKQIESCIESMAEPKEAKEFRLPVKAENFADYTDQVLEDLKTKIENKSIEGLSLELPNYEGVRVNADEKHGDGWFLIRKSLHEPLMPLNIESNKEGGLDIIKEKVKDLLSNNELLDISLIK